MTETKRQDEHSGSPACSSPEGCCGCGGPLNDSGGCNACLDVERHNAWVDELKADVEWEHLVEFLDRLKE